MLSIYRYFGVTLQNLVARLTWCPEFVHPWPSLPIIQIHSHSDLAGGIFLNINSIKWFYDDQGCGNISSTFRSVVHWKMLLFFTPGLMEFEITGCLTSNQNSIQELIQSRLKPGNACCHLVQNPFSSILLSKNIKSNIYRTIIWPIILYGYETWSLILGEEHRLLY
jgi:hypothetical protein